MLARVTVSVNADVFMEHGVLYTEWAKKVSCRIAGCNFVSCGPT